MHPEVLTPDYIFTFGRNRGRRLADIDVGYIAWCRKEIGWFRDAYDRMVNGEPQPPVETTLEQRTVERIQTGVATDGGGDLDDTRAGRVRLHIDKPRGQKKEEPEVDIGWLDRMGINFDRDRGRV